MTPNSRAKPKTRQTQQAQQTQQSIPKSSPDCGYSYSNQSQLSLLRHRCTPRLQARSPPPQGELHLFTVSFHPNSDATSH